MDRFRPSRWIPWFVLAVGCSTPQTSNPDSATHTDSATQDRIDGAQPPIDSATHADSNTADQARTDRVVFTDGSVSCTLGDQSALASTGPDNTDGIGTAESAVTVTNVGSSGTFPRVLSMAPGTFGQSCGTDACVHQDTPISGPLSPFDDEMTMNLRGPMEIYDFAVYQPDGNDWGRVASWNRCASSGVTFMNNKGGSRSGVWTMCGGNSQSYANASGSDSAAAPTEFLGTLGNGVEVNVLSDQMCVGSDDASECGFSRGVALHGWSGPNGAKIFAVRLRMPRYTGPTGGNYFDQPAIWMLNAHVVRAAQYGCNCRGVGAAGGCGELDVAEVVSTAHLTHAGSTIYSYQGAIGDDGSTASGHYFLRPVNVSATFIVAFDPARRIQMLRLAPDAFDFGNTIAGTTVTDWLSRTGHSMALP